MSPAPDWTKPHYRTFLKLQEGQQDFDGLMVDALNALKEEDDELEARFAASGWPPAILDEYNHGVLCLFELTVCFTIFKRLLGSAPARVVGWEHPYPSNRSWRADLVAHRPDGSPRWVLEAKWWQANSAKVLGVIAEDAEKIRAWPGVDARFVLAFWHSTQERWARDLQELDVGIQRLAVLGANLELAFLGAFASDVKAYRPKPGYFAMAALIAT